MSISKTGGSLLKKAIEEVENQRKAFGLNSQFPLTHSEIKDQQWGSLNAYIALYELIKENPMFVTADN